MTAPPQKAVHYESEIAFVPAPGGGLWVEKRYRADSDCVRWLNERLAEWYDPDAGQPVAQHEWAAYELLAPLGIAPPPVRRERDAIVVEFGGEPLAASSPIASDDYRAQAQAILARLAELGFRHNDLLERNVLVAEGRVRIIDFTLSEFGAVELMADLPNPSWAYPGRDGDLLHYLDELRRPRGLAPLARLRRALARRRRAREEPWIAS